MVWNVRAQNVEGVESCPGGPNCQGTITVRNRQRRRRVELRRLRQIVRAVLKEMWPGAGFDLGIYIVGQAEMTPLNEGFLRHKGSTDVITFDYTDKVGQASRLSSSSARVRRFSDRRDACPTLLQGEIFVCADEALSQARRFRTTWQSELVRYIVHGLLHLAGHDDLNIRARREDEKG